MNGVADGPKHTSAVETATRAPDGMTPAQVTALLLGIVSERTGYPGEMLSLDADLEADLGIDSIKRVEIVGSVVRGLTIPADKKVDLEPLTGSRSLRALIAKLVDVTAPLPHNGLSPSREGDQRPFDVAPSGSTVSRFLLRSVAALSTNTLGQLSKAGVVLVTDDERGIGKDLASRLVAAGYSTVRCVSTPPTTDDGSMVLMADLGSPAEITQLVDKIHQSFGTVSAIVHLAPLRADSAPVGFDRECWHRRLAVDLESLFLLTKALTRDLENAASAGGSAVLGAVSLGGDFATSGPASEIPGQGGISGYLKSLAQELPAVRVRTVDVGVPELETTSRRLWSELFSSDEYTEVGYVKSERTVLRLVESTVPLDPAGLGLDDNSVVLVTGGARGITAEVLPELVKHCQPLLIIVGRTSLPSSGEPTAYAGVVEPLTLRRLVLERHRRADESLTPRAVETEYQNVVRAREVLHNLTSLRQSGSRVEYHDCDVNNADSFGALIDRVYATHGRIDGVIHGAGVIEDKLVQDKTIESFERVIRTKVDGALVLASKLRPADLRFLVFFSSIAGRLGNRGQSDYAAANEIITS